LNAPNFKRSLLTGLDLDGTLMCTFQDLGVSAYQGINAET